MTDDKPLSTIVFNDLAPLLGRGRVLIIGSKCSGKTLAVNALMSACRGHEIDVTIADDAVSLDAGAMITSIAEAALPAHSTDQISEMLRQVDMVIVLPLRLLWPATGLILAMRIENFKLGHVQEAHLLNADQRQALICSRNRAPLIATVPLPSSPDSLNDANKPLYTSDDIRECTFPVGLAEFLANIKPAKARALAIEAALRKVAAGIAVS